MSIIKKCVCIVGGGFGGLYTALKLADFDVDITLIDQKDYFVFSPLLYELVNNTSNILEVCPTFKSLLTRSRIKFVKGNVQSINIHEGEILLEDTNLFSYDALVIAIGSHPNFNTIRGANEHALSFSNASDALRVKEKLKTLGSIAIQRKVNIVIIGGSYSGVELALSILPHFEVSKCNLTLIDRNSSIMKSSSEYNRTASET